MSRRSLKLGLYFGLSLLTVGCGSSGSGSAVVLPSPLSPSASPTAPAPEVRLIDVRVETVSGSSNAVVEADGAPAQRTLALRAMALYSR